MKIIAKIRTDFPEKFGVPRQSGLVDELKGKIVFEKKYRNEQALRGLEGYSHIWVIWRFDVANKEEFVTMVKPPRLGGNKRVGVFATRSPFRPNPLGLSCLKLEGIDISDKEGPVIYVSGIDMVDGTCIYDIKPYLPYADCRIDAKGGFSKKVFEHSLVVDETQLEMIPKDTRQRLVKVLGQDPRPGYTHEDSLREYGISFAGYNVRFTVKERTLSVLKVENEKDYHRNSSSC